MTQKSDQLNVFRLLRIARDIKVKDLAKELAITPAYINAIENGDRYPSDRLLRDYAKALDVEIAVIEQFNPDKTGDKIFENTLLKLLKIICGKNSNE